MAAPSRGAAATVISGLLGSLFLLFLAGPVIGVVGSGAAEGFRLLLSDGELQAALALTAKSATLATLLAFLGATPIAWLLERRRFRGRSLVAALLDIPLLIPHPVAGIALLLVLGRVTFAGRGLEMLGLHITGSATGIVLAMLFVSSPLYLNAARESFAKVDPRYESVARTLGDSPWRAFRRVTLPLSKRGLLAGAIVMWARSVSEFGAIVILVYHPQVASVLIWERFNVSGLRGAVPVAAVLVLLAVIPLVLLRMLRGDEIRESPRAT